MYRAYCLICSLFFFIASTCCIIYFSKELSEELRISNLINHGVHTQGVLTEEMDTGTRTYAYFIASYEAGNKVYELDWIDRNNKYKLNDTITVIYNKHDPSDYIVEGYYKSELAWIIMFGFTFVLGSIILAFLSLYDYYKVGYLEKNGHRILCEVVEYRWTRFSIPYGTVICKIPFDDKSKYKRYKGACGFTFRKLMEENNLKYIPLYILHNRKHFYYVNCDELRKIVKYKSYNGYMIEELQGL